MASEDELWEQMLKTEVSVDSVLSRIHKDEEELNSLKKKLIYQMTHGNSEWSDYMYSANTTDIRQLMINIILHLKKEKNLEKLQKMIKSFRISVIPVADKEEEDEDEEEEEKEKEEEDEKEKEEEEEEEGFITKLKNYSDYWSNIFNRMIGEDFKRNYFLVLSIINEPVFNGGKENVIYEEDEDDDEDDNFLYRTVIYQKNKHTQYSETCATNLSDKTRECWTDYEVDDDSKEDFAHLYEITLVRKFNLIQFLKLIEKIVVIEESLDEDKQWISLQQKNDVITKPHPPPHWIDDIVENDTEIIRICSEISTFLSNNARPDEITNFFRARNSGSAQFKLPILGSGPDTFIDPVKWYVREIIKPNGSSIVPNLKTAIEAMEKSLNVTLSDDNIIKASNPKHVFASVQLRGVLYFQEIYNVVLLREWSPHGGTIDKNIARQYVSLVLQLHRRIQAIMVENGFQQGGKIKRTIKRRKTKKAKKSKKMIMYHKK